MDHDSDAGWSDPELETVHHSDRVTQEEQENLQVQDHENNFLQQTINESKDEPDEPECLPTMRTKKEQQEDEQPSRRMPATPMSPASMSSKVRGAFGALARKSRLKMETEESIAISSDGEASTATKRSSKRSLASASVPGGAIVLWHGKGAKESSTKDSRESEDAEIVEPPRRRLRGKCRSTEFDKALAAKESDWKDQMHRWSRYLIEPMKSRRDILGDQIDIDLISLCTGNFSEGFQALVWN
jgi:hypothetical protein